MTDSVLKKTEVVVDEPTQLIESLADFVKVSSLYPPTNARVVESGERVLELTTALRGASPSLKIRALRDRFAVGQITVVSKKNNAEWFAECMTKTALGGIALEAGLTMESMLDFAGTLRRNASARQRATSFSELWADSFDGIVAMERMFVAGSEAWNRLPAETRQTLEEDSPRGAMLRRLLETGDSTCARLAETVGVEDSMSEDGFADGIDLMRRIVDLLPEDLIHDSRKCLDLLDAMLESAGEELADAERLPPDYAALEHRRLMIEVSAKYFTRDDGRGSDVMKEDDEPALPKGHAGDELVTDDIDEFVAEFDALPDGDLPDLTPDYVDAWNEKLGIVLDRLTRISDESEAQTLETWISEFSKRAGRSGRTLLQTYLEEICSPGENGDDWSRLERLSGLLYRSGLLRYLIDFKLLTPRIVAATFPATFGAFVDSLGDSPSDTDDLVEVCRQLGHARILECRNEFLGRTGVLTPARRRHLLGVPSVEILPFALMVLDSDDAEVVAEAVRYLGQLKLEDGESAALRTIDDSSLLPRRYLSALCRFEMGDISEQSSLRRMSEKLIREYIENPPRGVDTTRQVRAIGALRVFWSPRTREFVEGLLRGQGLLRLQHRPKAIRSAAKALLKTCRGRG